MNKEQDGEYTIGGIPERGKFFIPYPDRYPEYMGGINSGANISEKSRKQIEKAIAEGMKKQQTENGSLWAELGRISKRNGHNGL